MFADKTAVRQKCDADWCNGSTADSDSVSRGSSPLSVVTGVWLSLVERYVRDVEAAGSNPVTPIHPPFYGGFFIFHNVKAD